LAVAPPQARGDEAGARGDTHRTPWLAADEVEGRHPAATASSAALLRLAASSATPCNSGRPGRLHDLRVQRLHQGAVAVPAYDDIAGQQQPDVALDLECLRPELRVSGPQDQVRLDVLVELGLERRLHVDLGEHTAASVGKGRSGLLHCLIEAEGWS
jgi:hypothetical protein